MKTVKVTMKFEFETEVDEKDTEMLKEVIHEQLTNRIAEDEIMDSVKIKVVELEEEEDEELDYDDEEEF